MFQPPAAPLSDRAIRRPCRTVVEQDRDVDEAERGTQIRQRARKAGDDPVFGHVVAPERDPLGHTCRAQFRGLETDEQQHDRETLALCMAQEVQLRSDWIGENCLHDEGLATLHQILTHRFGEPRGRSGRGHRIER